MRFLKQLIYGTFWLVLFALIGWGVYVAFLKPAPTCSDGVKNGQEEGIDCGGVCATECLPLDLKPLTVRGNVNILPIGTSTNATILVQVQNSNSDYASKRFDYSLILSRQDGSRVYSMDGKDFIYSGEIKYIVFPNVALNEDPSVLKGEFILGSSNWVKESELKKPSAFVQAENTVALENKIEIRGKFTNGDAIPMGRAIIVGVLYDNSGNIIGASKTSSENINPGESRNFVITHPFIPRINVSKTQAFVYPEKD